MKETTDHDVPECEIVAAADRSAGAGRDDGAAVPGGHGPRVLAAWTRRREAGASIPDLLCPERDGHAVLVAKGRRHRIRALPHSRAAGRVPESNARAVGRQG